MNNDVTGNDVTANDETNNDETNNDVTSNDVWSRRVYRCGNCRQCGHNRTTCPLLAEQRHEANMVRHRARVELQKTQTALNQLITIHVHNSCAHNVIVFWGYISESDTDYRYLATVYAYDVCALRFNRGHRCIVIPEAEFHGVPMSSGYVLTQPITQTVFNEQRINDITTYSPSPDLQPLIIVNDIIGYKPPKNELERWKETAFKSMYLLTELKRMGAANNENLAPMIDMIEDITLPEHTELDKEFAGVPSAFTNIT